MVESLFELSKFVATGLPPYLKLSQTPRYEEGFLITLNSTSEIYEGLTTLEVSERNAKMLLYREQPGQIKGISPTVNVSNVKKALDRFLKFFDDDRLADLRRIILENIERIEMDILKVQNERKNERFFISVLVKENGETLLPAEVDRIREVFLDKNLRSKKSAGVCFLCGQRKPVAPRMNDVLKFSTFDKPGYTIGLRKKPEEILAICDDCFLDLSAARSYVEDNLSFSFFGDTLWIIPYGSDKAVRDFLRKIKGIEVFKKAGRERFAQQERMIEKHLSEEESLSYEFIVLHFEKSEMKILLHIPDVPPSRLARMVKVSEELDADLGQDPNFQSIFQLFKTPKTEVVGKRDFYSLVRSVYEGNPFSRKLFLSYAIRWLREQLISQGEIQKAGSLAFSAYLFLMRMGAFGSAGGVNMEGSFFERYADFFDEDWKKAVFLTGVLTGYIMDYQMKERGSAPFSKKLKGLKMRKEDVESLLADIKAKLIQYGIKDERVDSLLERASMYFVSAGKWSASTDEMNFVFATGLSLWKRFLRRDEDEQE